LKKKGLCQKNIENFKTNKHYFDNKNDQVLYIDSNTEEIFCSMCARNKKNRICHLHIDTKIFETLLDNNFISSRHSENKEKKKGV